MGLGAGLLPSYEHEGLTWAKSVIQPGLQNRFMAQRWQTLSINRVQTTHPRHGLIWRIPARTCLGYRANHDCRRQNGATIESSTLVVAHTITSLLCRAVRSYLTASSMS